MRIGILGSSFNPPHEGHMKISEEAINIFGLDQIWWLITKKNPFKDKDTYENFLDRKNKVKLMIDNQLIKLKYFEEESSSNFLIDNLLYIKKKFQKNNYIFLMGSDSFMEINKWKKYSDIFREIHIAVFNRNSKEFLIDNSEAGIQYKKSKIKIPARNIFDQALPCWTFISDFNIDISSSDIRKSLK